jgi:LytS/YehU family sensor histidine kinase
MQVAVPVDFRADVPEDLRKENPLIPPMLIQPFVENAFKHAFPSDKQDKTVRLRCYQENEDLVFEVRDNGIGLSGKGEGKGTSMGLALARERMKILNELKIENALDIRPAEPSGTVVEIRLKRNP